MAKSEIRHILNLVRRKLSIGAGFALTTLFSISIIIIASTSSFADSSGIGGKPANPDPNNPRTESIFVKTIAPGDTVSDNVEVINGSDVSKNISIYSTDSITSSGGAFACAQAADPIKSVGDWIKLSQKTVTVAPNSTIIVPFNINIPKSAEPGEQDGCIVLQEEKEPALQGGISLSFRTAIRVAILVKGDIVKNLSAVGLNISFNDTKLILSPEVKNTGNVSIDTTIETTLKSFFGQTIDTKTNTYPVLRDQLTNWNFEFDKPFWGGFYEASYELSYDKSNNFIGSNSEGAVIQWINGPKKMFFVLPNILAIIIELSVVTALVVIPTRIILNRNRKLEMKKTWVKYTIENEQLQDLAKRYNISWKQLAKVNNLIAPYTLKMGQILMVPPKKIDTKVRYRRIKRKK
jgi:hypothetical protein